MSRKYFIMCLVCVLWTIIQTSFHLVFVIFSYYLAICEKSPKDPNAIFFYLTYLYNSGCDKPTLEESVVHNSHPDGYIFKLMNKIYFDSTNSSALEEVVKALLEKIDFFPSNATNSSRASVFLLCFIILDGAWIVSAVSLLMGTCFGIKESLSLVFYGPWLVITICVAIFDATASVIFGFDIPSTTNFSDWLTFVGIIENKIQFPNFLDLPMSVTTAPSLTLCSVSARFILIWVSNWIAFFFVMKATISVYRESYKNENPNRPRTLVESPARRNRADPDTSAARIRNWQIFYGAVDASSVHSAKSVESERDLNSNSRDNREVQSEIASPGSSSSNFYYAYPDVAESVVVDTGGYLEELRGQLPWSYTQPQERRGSVEEKIELDNMPKHLRIKLDSSSSVTEL